LSDLLKKESPAMPGFLVSPIGRITSVDRASMQPACQRPAEERAWSRSAQGSSGLHWSSVAIDCSQYFLSRNGKKYFLGTLKTWHLFFRLQWRLGVLFIDG
jgi:hypothetical protein